MLCMFPDSKIEFKKMGNRSEFHWERIGTLTEGYYIVGLLFNIWCATKRRAPACDFTDFTDFVEVERKVEFLSHLSWITCRALSVQTPG